MFYSNGCYISGADHLPLLNSDGLNPGFIADNYCDNGYLGSECSLILPNGQLIQLVESSTQGNTREEVYFDLKAGVYHLALVVEGQLVGAEVLIVQ